MIVSWNWLKQYVTLAMPAEEIERRLMMAGLNHESTAAVGDDLAIDLEVTSNRPDCLGHLGIAREVAVLDEPAAEVPAGPAAGGRRRRWTSWSACGSIARELCPRYTARVVRGVTVRPSPRWLATGWRPWAWRRSTTSWTSPTTCSWSAASRCTPSITPSSAGREIIVRGPRPGETIEAIDHKTYALEPDMCVIADARDAVAIAGVMGGAATEVSPATTAVLVESAEFDPVAIRNTARRLNLHSDSSYRFERPLDPEGIDWASRRCCELILELAGGELAAGVVDVGRRAAAAAAHRPAVLPAEADPGHRRGAGAGAADPRRPGQRRDAAGRRRATAGDRRSRCRRPVGAATCRGRSTWSRKSPASTATRRFPKTWACRWPHRPAAARTACWRRSARCWWRRAWTRR